MFVKIGPATHDLLVTTIFGKFPEKNIPEIPPLSKSSSIPYVSGKSFRSENSQIFAKA
jgi:hypothetical protein